MVRLNELFGSKSALKILDYFLANPTKKTYAAEIIKAVRLSRKSLFDSLRHLEANGLLASVRIGRATLYKLNNENQLVRQLKILHAMSEIMPHFKNLNERTSVFLYGSAARGEDTETSDIDILVISDIKPVKLLGRNIRRGGSDRATPKINYLFFTPLEYSRLSREDRALFERIEKDKIRLV